MVVGSWLPLTDEAVSGEVHEAGQVVGCGGRVCTQGGGELGLGEGPLSKL